MGKIKVETCHIEGLKVITPTVFGDESRIISPAQKKECCGDSISRSITLRISS